MTSNRAIRTILVLAAALLLAPAASQAQFPGDLFFAEPSVAVPEGGVATFEVLLFSGAHVVGATHFEVIVDPTQAEVVGVEAGATAQLASGHAAVISPGRAAVVDLNGESLTQPIGTSSLAHIQVRPLVGAGSRIPLSIQVRSLLRQDLLPLPGGRGFGGELLVVSAGPVGQAATVTSVATPATDDADTARRAAELRRPGLAVDLLDFETRGANVSAVPRRVVVPDPAAPSEAPPQ